MSSYIGEKYAAILTEEDVGNLFNALVKKLGNRSEAARQCGLTGKATYDWEETKYVKLQTKRKVLEACLKNDFPETIEYLLSRSSERTVDVLRTVLSTIYADAVEADSREELEVILDKFEALKIRHRGLIRDTIEDEVSDMENRLCEKAQRSGVPLRRKPIEDLSAKELLDQLPMITHFYLENPLEAENFAREDLVLPEEALKPIFQTFRDLTHVRDVTASTVAAGNPVLEKYKYPMVDGSVIYWTNVISGIKGEKEGEAIENITRT